MNAFDLQIQSTASDGKHAPGEIVQMARDLGIGVIAITDHDTIAGLYEAASAAADLGVRVIPGIEISVEYRGLHILGYGIDRHHTGLLAELEKSKQGRMDSARKTIENLKGAGFVVEWEDVLKQATGAVVARPHVARAILARPENKGKLGGIATSHDFIQQYLTDKSPYYVRRVQIGARDAVAFIHDAGGVAVWSHPAIHFERNYDELERTLNELIAWELEGIEVFNPSHTEDDTEFVNGLALKYGLLSTGGSDFHEKGEHASDERGLHSARTLGDFETYGFGTGDIIPRLDEAVSKRASG